MPRLGLGLGLDIVRRIKGGGIPPDPPIARRDLLQENGDFILQEDGVSKIVITFGTFDSLLTESGNFLVQEDSGKLIIAIY
jgi:hypothetical protein